MPDLFVHSPRVGLGCWPVSLVSWLSLQLGAEAAPVIMQKLVWAGRAKQVWEGLAPAVNGSAGCHPDRAKGVWRTLKGGLLGQTERPEENEESEIFLTELLTRVCKKRRKSQQGILVC